MMPIALLLRGLTGPFGLLLVVLALGLGGVRADGRPQPEAGLGFTARPIALGDRYMAVTTNPHATQAAVEMLARCGSALDAAIAAQLVLNVVEPQPSGIGGGGFLLHYDRASGRVQAYDGRETALATARPDGFLRPDGQALTSSLEDAFGSRLMVQGFLLNNQLTDFAFSPEQAGHAVANRVEGGKRPLSAMASALVFDREGRLHAVLGSPVGDRIINCAIGSVAASPSAWKVVRRTSASAHPEKRPPEGGWWTHVGVP